MINELMKIIVYMLKIEIKLYELKVILGQRENE